MAAEKSARLDQASMGKTTGLMETSVDANLRNSRSQAGKPVHCSGQHTLGMQRTCQAGLSLTPHFA